MTSNKRTPALAALLVTGAVALSGCSADDPAPAAAATATASTPTGCGDVATVVQKHLTSSDVDSVVVIGQCTTIRIGTGLADDDTATGAKLCDQAAEVAYTADVNSVSVVSGSGTELATGITGMKCLPSA